MLLPAKKTLTKLIIILVFKSISLQGEILNITDMNFKNALLNYNPKIDLNLDGQIQKSEATNITELILNNKQIKKLNGIESFTSLKNLYVSNNEIDSLDISSLST